VTRQSDAFGSAYGARAAHFLETEKKEKASRAAGEKGEGGRGGARDKENKP